MRHRAEHVHISRTVARTGWALALWTGLALGCGDSAAVVAGDTGSSTSTSTEAPTGVTTSAGGGGSSDTSNGDTSVDPTSSVGSSSSESSDTSAATDTSGGSGTSGASETDTDPGTTDPGTSTGGDPPPAVPGPKVKIMTFNIRVGTAADGENAWDKRKGLVFQVFKDQDADFIGVQEALKFQLVAIDEAVPAYDRIGIATVDGKAQGPFNAIYYRKSRFAVKKSDTFWLSNTPEQPGSKTWGNEFPRAVTWGRFVEKDTDYTFYIYNTHFDHVSQNSREKGAVLLAETIAARSASDDPFAVTGDFNAAEGNLAIRFLKGDAKIDGNTNAVPMRDTFRVEHPDADNVGTAHGFNGGTGGNKIDYIFVPPKQKVNGAQIDHFNDKGRYPSDHFPVVGTVTFETK